MLGRETFLTSVSFQGEQPIFNPGIGRVLMEDKFPNLPEFPVDLFADSCSSPQRIGVARLL